MNSAEFVFYMMDRYIDFLKNTFVVGTWSMWGILVTGFFVWWLFRKFHND